MKSKLITTDGRTITVQPLPHSKQILIQSHDPHAGSLMHLVMPADMAEMFAQAIECAGAAAMPAPSMAAATRDAITFGAGLGMPG